jgi:gluconolactonase
MRKKQFRTTFVCLALVGMVTLTGVGQTPIVNNIVKLDPALDKIIPSGAKLDKVYGDARFTEGPLWIRDGGYLLFSDLMNNAIMKWTPSGDGSVYRKPIFSGSFPDGVLIGSNGLTLDKQKRLIAAEHGNRRLVRIEKDGSVKVLADRYEGRRLNSPNDVVVKGNGDIYFTDPPALYRTYPEGPDKPKQELDFNGLYRITAAGKLELLTKEVQYPNGIAFSPDEKTLYVSSSRPDKYWMAYPVQSSGVLGAGRKLADVTQEPGEGVPDGMKIDAAGNIYATALDGVLIFSAQGKRLGTIKIPEIPSNCAWGDSDGKTLYITARTGVYKIRLNIAGIRP